MTSQTYQKTQIRTGWSSAILFNTLALSPLYWSVFVAGFVWVIFVAANSPDAIFQDEVAHILMSRDAWQHPELMLNIWGRPFNTIIYMLPSLGGLVAARWFSLIFSGISVILATKVAEKLNLKALWLIPLCLWFQPWFADLSYTANTMTPFSFLLILGIYLWVNDKATWASLRYVMHLAG